MIAILLAIASIHFVDDTGRARSVDEWRGTPTIVVPMYTRCPLLCPTIAKNVQRALRDENINDYRVVFFSFDPRDTPADLRRFRERLHIPLAWTVATATHADTRRLLESLDYRYSETMAHPAVVIALTPGWRSQIFSGNAIGEALAFARGGRDWVGSLGKYVFALLLLASMLSSVALVNAFVSREPRTG